jgi:hypothetical protein
MGSRVDYPHRYPIVDTNLKSDFVSHIIMKSNDFVDLVDLVPKRRFGHINLRFEPALRVAARRRGRSSLADVAGREAPGRVLRKEGIFEMKRQTRT